jgi:hypothetical protein
MRRVLFVLVVIGLMWLYASSTQKVPTESSITDQMTEWMRQHTPHN